MRICYTEFLAKSKMTFNTIVFKDSGKELNKVRMLMDDMKQEFSEEIEILKKRDDEEMNQLLRLAALTEDLGSISSAHKHG